MDCPTCGKTLSTERGMRQHHTKVHDDPLPNRTCADCGTEFYDPKSRRTYCEDCYSQAGAKNGNYSSAKETTECEQCGDSFDYYPSNKDGVYCSECVEEADGLLPGERSSVAHVEVECEYCGETLERHPSRVESASYGEFCDLDCYGEWLSENVVGESHHQWEGGTIPYGSSWWQVRRAALVRDEYECQNCGAGVEELGRKPDVHHIDRVRDFDDPADAHKLDNVVCLCRSCHRRVEDGDVALPSSDS
jgi:5-methylcytosine-specific restriction endonuclease McrA